MIFISLDMIVKCLEMPLRSGIFSYSIFQLPLLKHITILLFTDKILDLQSAPVTILEKSEMILLYPIKFISIMVGMLFFKQLVLKKPENINPIISHGKPCSQNGSLSSKPIVSAQSIKSSIFFFDNFSPPDRKS